MYTTSDLRQRGIGAAIINYLEEHARRHGAHRAILETGVRNHGALALYLGVGYRATERYVPGRDPAINCAFIKDLAGPERGRPGRRGIGSRRTNTSPGR
jgi:ribosomal protein S18 acetylase RimI-like enzyme